MRTSAPFLLVPVLVLALAQPASAATFTEEGTISYGNPLNRNIGGVTEIVTPCDPQGGLQGFDGWWIKLPSGSVGKQAALKSSGVDTNVYFYDGSGCGFVSNSDDPNALGMATDLTPDEQGTIPNGAAWAIVDLIVGYEATFTFSVTL